MAQFGIANSSYTYLLTRWSMLTTPLPVITVANSYNTTNAQFAAGSSAYRRGKVYDLLVGTDGTPADQAVSWDLNLVTQGCTTAAWTAFGISSVSSSFVLDQADAGGAFNSIAINTTGSSATQYTTIYQKWFVGVNSRASYRWVAAPGSEIVWPAASSAAVNGVNLRAYSASGYTGTATGTMFVQEV